MTPFGTKFREFRKSKKKRQKAIAYALGVLPCHLSQVERGTKGPFQSAVRAKIKNALELTDIEANELEKLAAESNRTFRLPANATTIDFRIAALLSKCGSGSIGYRIEIARLALTNCEEFHVP